VVHLLGVDEAIVGGSEDVPVDASQPVHRRPARNPQADWDANLLTTPPDLMLDFRNNVVWGHTADGTIVHRNATASVVDAQLRR
jgi:hypothetical protein